MGHVLWPTCITYRCKLLRFGDEDNKLRVLRDHLALLHQMRKLITGERQKYDQGHTSSLTGFKVCALTIGKAAGERAPNWFSGFLLPLTLVYYVSLAKALSHSEPQFPHISSKPTDSSYSECF